MDMFEEATAILGTMRLCKLTQAEMADRLGVSQSYVANKLRLLKLDEKTRAQILASGLTERHARALLRLGTEERQQALSRICEDRLNVAQTEALVDCIRDVSLPKRVGIAEQHRRIDTFKDGVRSCVKTLAALGVDVHQSTSTHGGKTYITVAIDERA